MATVEQQAVAPKPQTAARSSNAQLPRLNHRRMTNYEDYQESNIAALTEMLGENPNHTIRLAVNVLSELFGLPVKTDYARIILNSYFVRLSQQNGGPTDGR